MNNRLLTLKIRNCLCGLAAMLLFACADEELPGGASDLTLKEGEIALQWLPANMGVQLSRGTDSKTNAEKEIKNIHVFLFGPDGNYLDAGQNAFQGYKYLDAGNTSVVLQTGLFADQNAAGDATIYVLANMPENRFTRAEGDLYPKEVPNMEALEKMVINLPTFTTSIPESGLPMVLKHDADLSDDAQTKIIPLQLKSMMARIDLNFTMDPLESDGSYPSLEFTNVSVGNFPKGGKVVSQLVNWDGTIIGENKETVDGVGTDIELTSKDGEEVKNAELLGKILRDGNPQQMTFYMFEHARVKNGEFTYPTDDDDKDKHQRYKNQLVEDGYVKDDAAYIELEGSYASQNQFRYRIKYRLYVGANPEDDFTIKPNCQYKNNITVTGITVNNYGDEALLDTRVTIDEDTPAFLEILRERMHDAHFNVTPMDVYFNRQNASVTIEILDEDGNPAAANEMEWIRMESYHDAYTATDADLYDFGEGGKSADNQYAARFAGDGKRKYFTVDLLSELETTHGENSRTCTMNATDGKEQRVYFYIDENVPEANSLPEQVPARSATLRITYKEDGETVATKTALISQAGMRRVYFNKFSAGASQGGYNDYGRAAYYFYIEEYEEYLAHYDPKNEYTHTYEGLEWGLDGLHSGLGVSGEFYQYLSWGWYNTAKIMAQYRVYNGDDDGNGAWRGHEMTLNEKPSGAAEYCYNKNKRERGSDGFLTDKNVRWFLPTTSELEYALEAHYTSYEVFQDKWYWSSNPGATWNPTEGGDNGENRDYARATRIYYDPNNPEADRYSGFVHYRSNPDYIYMPDGSDKYPGTKGIGGYAERSETFRIRAAYIPAGQIPNDRELTQRYNYNGSVR